MKNMTDVKIRLQKFMAESGVASRRKAEELKRQLAVVNGKLDNLQTQNEALRAELARLKQEK